MQHVSRPSKEAISIRMADDPTQAFLDRIVERLDKLDAVLVISGPEGYTKSTCAEHLARITDPTFDNSRIAYDNRTYAELIRDLPSGCAVLPDEGVEMFHNRNSMTRDSKFINEVLMESRIMHLAHFICFPRMQSVDVYLREFRVWAWVRCLEPGKAEVRIRNWNVPVGDTMEEAFEAYTPVCGLTYPPIDKASWDKREMKKVNYIKEKITKYLD